MAIHTRKEAYVRAGNIIISGATHGDFISIYALESKPNGEPINFLSIEKGSFKRTKAIEGADGPEFLRVPGWGGDKLLQDLVDALVAFGIKPQQTSLDAQERAAVEKHLQDMRKIVGKKLGVEL